MNKKIGIYTLANDAVFDQVIALINSIRQNYSHNIPICIIPYDDNVEKLSNEIKKLDGVSIFDDVGSIKRWELFAQDVWRLHPFAFKVWQEKGINGINRLGMHRKFCAFDGEFDKFILVDADALFMRPMDPFFNKLDEYNFVVYDYQYKDPSHVYDVNSSRIYEVFNEEKINRDIFCAGFFASKRGLLSEDAQKKVLSFLSDNEAEILYINGPDQTLINYIVMRVGYSIYNFAFDQNFPHVGNAVTSLHFENKDNVLYDNDKKLFYLHYIGVSARVIAKVCQGYNIDFPYRDIFLHYRYLHESEKVPKFKGKPKKYNTFPGIVERAMKKLKNIFNFNN